jgi:hypothetical protein BACCOPRO_02230
MQIAIVVPCYNEEPVLSVTNEVLLSVCEKLKADQAVDTRILYVDDGSSDSTWDLIETYSQKNRRVGGLKLAHNVGHQRALWAGLDWAAHHADAAISIDADLQDDVEAIYEMVQRFLEGKDIVYGVRHARKTDTWFKRTTAQTFYKMVRGLGGDVLYNHADFRLMSRRALEALLEYSERNLFLRGMVRTLGFQTAIVLYDRKERQAGVSKYPLGKMLSFAVDGITSFSVRPLRYITYLGLIFMFISLAAIIYAIVVYAEGRTIQGWTSLLVSLWFIGGAILVALGVIGEYVGKIYSEVKRRPRYIVEKTI